MKVSDFVGNYALHEHYGRVFVDGSPPKSKAMVDITVKQRGRGWDEPTETYRRFFIGSSLKSDGSRSLRWGFTHKDDYGTKDQVNIKTLSKWK
jgi:hypothetical protein